MDRHGDGIGKTRHHFVDTIIDNFINEVVQSALIRNPRVSMEEVTALARGPSLAPDAAEALAQHPSFGSSAQIALALVRNSRTPLPTATAMVAKLTPTDLRTIAKGLGVRAPVAAAARKRLNDPR